jgi:putrescine transport system ATP-binding protein
MITARWLNVNRTRMLERPIGWDDKVWLTWPAEAGIIVTR